MYRPLSGCVAAIVALAATVSAQAVIYGPHGTNGTYNAYQWISNDVSWDQHRFNSLSTSHLGATGHLVTISDAAENAFVNRIGINDRFIGLTDADSTVTSTLDGFNAGTQLGASEAGSSRVTGWRWVDGTPYDGNVFHAWNAGEPNNSGNEDAVHYTGTAGLWNDNNAGTTFGDTASHNADAIREYNTNIPLTQLQAWQARIVKVQDVLIPGVTVGNLAEAKQVIAGTRPLPAGTPQLLQPTFNGGSPLTEQRNTINMVNNATNQGLFTPDDQYPGFGVAPFTGDQNNFVIRATGSFATGVLGGGQYTFGLNSDDGFGLIVRDANTNAIVPFDDWSGQGGTTIVGGELQFPNGRGHSNTATATAVGSYGRITLQNSSQYNFELVHWEGTGGTAVLEAYYMLGTPTDYAPNATGTNLSFSE
jgi:hypothetical protein